MVEDEFPEMATAVMPYLLNSTFLLLDGPSLPEGKTGNDEEVEPGNCGWHQVIREGGAATRSADCALFCAHPIKNHRNWYPSARTPLRRKLFSLSVIP